MAAEEATDEKEATAPAPAPSGNKLLLIFAGVNTVLVVGMIVVLMISFFQSKKQPVIEDIVVERSQDGKAGEGEAKTTAEGKASPKFGVMVALEQFTVNLSTVGSVNPKFARVNISLEVPGVDTEAEITQKMPQIRNTVIDLFNSKRPADLATAEGRNFLKEEIRNALNSFLISGKIKGVFFTSFALSS